MNNQTNSTHNHYPEDFNQESQNTFDRLFQKARGVEMLPEDKKKGLEKLKDYIKSHPDKDKL
jgi:hypothetical protein